MQPTPFAELNDVLARLVEGNREALGPDLIGIFLSGSFALGDADEGSDVDFLVVTRTFLTQRQQEAVQHVQRTLYDSSPHWGKHLEGSYFPEALLRHPDPARTPIPHFNHGGRELTLSDHDNTLVVRWVTREHGLALAGPPARELIAVVDPDELRAEVWSLLHKWGHALLGESEDSARGLAWIPDGLNNDWVQPLVVLLMTRMVQTLSTGRVHSKKAAVDWARLHLDARWTPLLERAWAKHADQFLRYQGAADPDDVTLTREFIPYALALTPTPSSLLVLPIPR